MVDNQRLRFTEIGFLRGGMAPGRIFARISSAGSNFSPKAKTLQGLEGEDFPPTFLHALFCVGSNNPPYPCLPLVPRRSLNSFQEMKKEKTPPAAFNPPPHDNVPRCRDRWRCHHSLPPVVVVVVVVGGGGGVRGGICVLSPLHRNVLRASFWLGSDRGGGGGVVVGVVVPPPLPNHQSHRRRLREQRR